MVCIATPNPYSNLLEIMDVGIKYFNKGDYTNALEVFEQALKDHPKHSLPLQYIGMCKCLLAKNELDVQETLVYFKPVAQSLYEIVEGASEQLDYQVLGKDDTK